MTSIQLSAKSIIRVRLLLFGAIAEAAEFREKIVELYDGSTVGDLHAGILSDHPAVRGLVVKYAVDQMYCSGGHMLADGEEVAFFNAVSGG